MIIHGIIVTDLSDNISNAPVVFSDGNGEEFYLAQTNYCDRIINFVPYDAPVIHRRTLITPVDEKLLKKKEKGPFLLLFHRSALQGNLEQITFQIGDEPPHLCFQFPYITVD